MSTSDRSSSLEGLLNSSTPYAPRDADDLRARIEAHQPEPAVSTSEPLQGESPVPGGQPRAPEAHPRGPGTNSHSVDNSTDAKMLFKEEPKPEILSTGSELARLRAEQADRFMEEQRRKVFQAKSEDGRVAASVDGTGQLIGLQIDDALLHGSESLRIGQKITEATNAAAIESFKHFSPPDWSSF